VTDSDTVVGFPLSKTDKKRHEVLAIRKGDVEKATLITGNI